MRNDCVIVVVGTNSEVIRAQIASFRGHAPDLVVVSNPRPAPSVMALRPYPTEVPIIEVRNSPSFIPDNRAGRRVRSGKRASYQDPNRVRNQRKAR